MTEGRAIQETYGAKALIEGAPTHLPLQQVELILTDLVSTEVLRRAAEVGCESLHMPYIGLDGARTPIAELQIFDIALSQGRHGETPANREEEKETRVSHSSTMLAGPSAQQGRITALIGTGGPRSE